MDEVQELIARYKSIMSRLQRWCPREFRYATQAHLVDKYPALLPKRWLDKLARQKTDPGFTAFPGAPSM
jgi:hypothetical protein